MQTPGRVLLLLDVQVANFAPPPIGVPASAVLGRNIQRVLTVARQARNPPLIIHVRNAGDPGEPDEANASGWQLAYQPLPNEPVVDKRKNNAFTGTRLGALIHPHAELVVIGLHSDFSLRATCSSALDRGNEVLLIRGAHGTHDRLEVLYGGGVTPAALVAAEIEAELEEAGVHIFEMKDLSQLLRDR